MSKAKRVQVFDWAGADQRSFQEFRRIHLPRRTCISMIGLVSGLR